MKKSSETEKRDERGRLVVPLYSEFFSALTDNVMCTNAMYGTLYEEIEASISLYSEKEPIVLSVYESSDAAEDVREGVLIGFRKYILQFKKKEVSVLLRQFALFFTVALVGVFLEILLHTMLPESFPVWAGNIVEIVAWAFVWQLTGFMAFEFFGKWRNIRRFSQILRIDYEFHHWE